MAFDRNYAMEEVVLPDGITTLSDGVFQFCTSLRHVNLPNSLNQVGSWAFYGCSQLDTIVFPDHLQSIGHSTMCICTHLKYCHLPEQLEQVEPWTLYGTALEEIVIPSHVTIIDTQSFAGCLQLHKMTLPASLTALSDSIFIDGTNLDTLILLCSNPPTVLESTFPTYTATLIVPCGATAAYRQHPIWSRFTDITEDCNAIEGIESDNFNVYVRDGRIVVDGADGETVQVYDMMGRETQSFKQSSNQALASGVYLVQVGTSPARKVVVTK